MPVVANMLSASAGDVSDTLWTLTLMELLLDTLSKGGSDEEVLSTVDELYARRLNANYLLRKVRYHLGVMEMLRLKVLIAITY